MEITFAYLALLSHCYKYHGIVAVVVVGFFYSIWFNKFIAAQCRKKTHMLYIL